MTIRVQFFWTKEEVCNGNILGILYIAKCLVACFIPMCPLFRGSTVFPNTIKVVYLLFNVGDGDRGSHRDNERSPALWAGGVWLGSRLEVREHGLYLSHHPKDLVRLCRQDYHIRVEDHVFVVCRGVHS